MMDLVCSIVVRAYNEEAHIGRLFSGFNQQSISNFEVILVDSGSTDATIGIVQGESWNFHVQVISIQPEKFSFGHSLNLGIKQALSGTIVIASAHVYPVYPDWIERLISPFSEPEVGLVYGKQRGGTTTRFPEHQIFARWFPDQSKIQTSNPFCNNANAAIRKDLWIEHNYDETLSGLEDLEWANWAINQGHQVAYVSEAEIVHLHEDTPNGVYNRYRREAMAFKRIFPQEKFGFLDFIKLFFSNLISDARIAKKNAKLVKEFATIIWFRLMQFWGTYRGYQQSGPLTQELRQTFYYPGSTSKQSTQESRSVKPIQYED
ncbi:MAG: glycosyltransferase family 2 protein [Anaerolineales bacterium]|nr:glycosyltransferase family 2 protein [Anaerolineales bacterium]